MKKGGRLSNLTMGAFNGAKVCELVGKFLLENLSQKYNKKNIGLYCGDGVAVFKNICGPDSEKVKKHL